MPMIDSDLIKHGLMPVQDAKARHEQALAAMDAAQEAGENIAAQLEQVAQAREAYRDACIGLHGYIRAVVNQAEGRSSDQDG